MTPSDVRLIDPTFGALATAVLKAARVANGRMRHDRIDKDVPSWHRALRRVWKKGSGRQEWPRTGWFFNAPLVRLAWWTDRLGRKHWRVEGTRRPAPGSDAFGHNWPLANHALWHVYPDRLLWRRVGRREEVLAACACGEVGTPEAISWTGERCGPCHDRLEEGGPMPPERPFRLERQRHTETVVQMRFLPGGRMVTGGADGRVVLWEEDGSSQVLLHRRNGFVLSLAASPAGVIAASTAYEELLLRDPNREKDWRAVALPAGHYHPPTYQFTPDGEQLVVWADNHVYLVDPADPVPTLRPVLEGRAVAGLELSPDGAAVYAFEMTGALVRIELATGAVWPLRAAPARQDFAGLGEDELEFFEDEYGGAPVQACSPDGRWLVTTEAWQSQAGLHRCDLHSGQWAPLRQQATYGLRSVAFSSPDEVMAVNGDGSVSVWALSDARLKATWGPGAAPTHGPAFLSPEGEWLVHARQDGALVLFPWKDVLAAAP